MAPTLASALTLSAAAIASKTFLRLTTKSYDVEGLPILLDALREDKGKGRAIDGEEEIGPEPRRGLVTVSNHTSVVDDPGMWSMIPLSNFFPFAGPSHVSRNSRWTLGASDIMFTKPLHSKFFTLGQVIETHRGGGIFQPAVDQAVKLLQTGAWIHIFPEGKVNQKKTHPEGGLWRFKWGVGRIIMDSLIIPEILPIWVSGFDQVMPETREFPRFIPRVGARIRITIGKSLTPRIRPLIEEWRAVAEKESGAVGIGGEWSEGKGDREVRSRGELADGREQALRIKICEILQEAVRELGEAVERKEGKFERGEWSNSMASVDHPA